MKRILITGATGNVGSEVIHYLNDLQSDLEIHAAVRNIENAKDVFHNFPDLHFRHFDFENNLTYSAAFSHIDILFLLRPPHISDIENIFRPLLISARKNGISKVVFLSVQGAEKSKVIPHNKVERLIHQLGFNFIFVRPSYFMQNLTTTLLDEIVDKGRITLPSGKARFNWVDIKNIGEATARLILDFQTYQDRAYEITGIENKSFGEVVALINEVTGSRLQFKSIDPISFYFRKKKEGMKNGFAFVMTALHFLPRLQSEPRISDNYQLLTGKYPTTLHEFIIREKETLTKSQ